LRNHRAGRRRFPPLRYCGTGTGLIHDLPNQLSRARYLSLATRPPPLAAPCNCSPSCRLRAQRGKPEAAFSPFRFRMKFILTVEQRPGAIQPGPLNFSPEGNCPHRINQACPSASLVGAIVPSSRNSPGPNRSGPSGCGTPSRMGSARWPQAEAPARESFTPFPAGCPAAAGTIRAEEAGQGVPSNVSRAQGRPAVRTGLLITRVMASTPPRPMIPAGRLFRAHSGPGGNSFIVEPDGSGWRVFYQIRRSGGRGLGR